MAKTAQAVIETKVKDGASSGFRNMQREMDKTAKRGKVLNQQFRFMRGGLGQVGHQIQDVAVQLQMGQDKLLVLGQQGGQVASIFGPGGAVVGAILSVGAAIAMGLMPKLMAASSGMKRLNDSGEDLIDRFDSLTGAAREYALELAKIKMKELKDELAALEQEEQKGRKTRQQGLKANRKFTESQEAYAKRLRETRAAIQLNQEEQDRLAQKVDGTTESFLKQEKAMLKEIETHGMSSREIRDYEIRQQAKRGEIELTEAIQLIHHNAELQRLDEKLAAEKKLAEEKKKIAEFENATLAGKTEMMTGELAKQLQGVRGHSKKLFALQKAASIANTLINTYEAAQTAFKLYGGFPTGVPMAAASIAAGMAKVSAIKAQSFDGGGFTGSGARSGGIDGKGGFPAILHPNETVIDHTRGGGAGVVVNQTINVTTGVQQTVRAEIQSMMPRIAEETKMAVANAKIRGGAYGRMMS